MLLVKISNFNATRKDIKDKISSRCFSSTRRGNILKSPSSSRGRHDLEFLLLLKEDTTWSFCFVLKVYFVLC